MQTILVAVDDSEAAGRAAETAAELAAALGARLIAISVVGDVAARTDAVRAVQRRLQSLGRELGLDVDVRTVHGHADGLVEQAGAVGADLVVVAGSAQRPDPIAEAAGQLLATCRVPVLVVPAAD